MIGKINKQTSGNRFDRQRSEDRTIRINRAVKQIKQKEQIKRIKNRKF